MTLMDDPTRSRQRLPRRRECRLTEAEYVRWAFSPAAELLKTEWVDGRVVVMSPVADEHDVLQWWLKTLLLLYCEHHDLGNVRGPEFTARFASQKIRRVPDVMFIAKTRVDQLTTNHFEGAPDLIIQIVSPDSESRDWRIKYREYERAGVREYWVVDPMSQIIEAYTLTSKGYKEIAEKSGKISSKVVRGWFIKPAWVWDKKRASVLNALAELGVRSSRR